MTASVGEAWVRLEATLAITRDAERLNVAISAARGAGRPCFLVDDVTLVRVR